VLGQASYVAKEWHVSFFIHTTALQIQLAQHAALMHIYMY